MEQRLKRPYFSAFWLVVFVTTAVVAAEVLVMNLLRRYLGGIDHPRYELFEPLLMAVILVPVLYFSIYRPVRLYMKKLSDTTDELLRVQEQYQTLVESTDDSIYLVDRNYTYLFLNRKHLTRLGTQENPIGRSYRDFHSEQEAVEFIGIVDEVFRTGESIQHEHRSRRDGKSFLRTLSPVKDPDGTVAAVTVISKNITDRKRMEDELKALTLTDPLTGLYNRRGFFELAGTQLRLAGRMKRPMVLLFADLDGLKAINDRFGHQAGDAALIAVAKILQATHRDSDIIARIGGDEFVLLPVEVSEEGVPFIIDRLEERLEEYNRSGRLPFKISLSTGMSIFDPEKPRSLDELLIVADQAMYDRKRQRPLF